MLSGSDDELLCNLLHIPISGVLVAAERIGHRAAELLYDLMNGRRAPKQPVLVPPLTIVSRRSTDTLAIPDPALIKALSFIRMNPGTPVQVDEVAQRAGVSRRVLERRFAQFLGRSPATEIRRTHLERAKQLLAETDLPVPDVSDAAGFGSPEYMAYVFREDTGTTPIQYRKEARNR